MVMRWLTYERHSVDLAEDGATALERLRMGKYDVVLLDWTMPHMNGLEVLRTFRSEGGATPVLFMTARRSEGEIETGLDAGADDYITKPFSMKVMSAHVRALLRRPAGQPQSTLQAGDLLLDPVSHSVTRGGNHIQLMPREFALLEFFMRHPDVLFNAEALVQRIWPDDSEMSADSIRSYISRLRQKLGDDKGSLIQTIPRLGYLLKRPK